MGCEGRMRSRIRETPNLLTDADSSTNIFVSAGIKKGADSFFFFCPQKNSPAPPHGAAAVVLLSASVERFGVSRMQDFFYYKHRIGEPKVKEMLKLNLELKSHNISSN